MDKKKNFRKPKKLLSDLDMVLKINIPTYKVGKLENKFVKSDIQINKKDITATPFSKFEDDDMVKLTPKDLNQKVYNYNTIILSSFDVKTTHKKQGGFTIKDLWSAILNHERVARLESNWFGGIDAHHIYFEGLNLQKEGYYTIFWGS